MDKSLIKVQQENIELKKENQALKETVSKLLVALDESRGITHLSTVEREKLSPEQGIIEDQIIQLEAVSITRQLTLDETRTLDLLIKNKRILDSQKPFEPQYSSFEEPTESDLLRIAGNVESETKSRRTKSKASKKDPVA